MSWRNKLYHASFRGVAFETQSDSEEFGPRYQVHRYPLRKKPYTQYLGDKENSFTVQAVLLDDAQSDYRSKADKLRSEIRKPGPGTLIHPKFGAMQVVVLNCVPSESSANGGMARFSITFVEYGGLPQPEDTPDTVGAVNTSATACLLAAQSDFADQFESTGVDDIDAETLERGASLTRTLRDINGKIAAVSAPLDAVVHDINAFSDQLNTLVSTPVTLAAKLGGVVSSVMGSAKDLRTSLRSLRSIGLMFAQTDEIQSNTPARAQQRLNHRLMEQLSTITATVEAVRVITDLSSSIDIVTNDNSPFDSFDHAIAVRDELSDALQALANESSDALYGELKTLRSAFVQHIKAHGFNLERLTTYQPTLSVPALVLAHQLYGSTQRSGDIVRRNRIRHPLFITPHAPLEVLSG